MAKRPPRRIALDPDDYHAKHVGHTADGRQFFLTTPFVPGLGGPGSEFVALYTFDAAGKLLDADITDFGPRDQVDAAAHTARHDELLASLGPVTRKRIVMAPFRIERFGVVFGLIPELCDDTDDVWIVTFEPGNVMAFHTPWSSGDYDT